MKVTKLLMLATAAFFAATMAQATPITMDFGVGQNSFGNATPFEEDGFRMTPTNTFDFRSDPNAASAGRFVFLVLNGFETQKVTFDRIGGGTFDFLGFEFGIRSQNSTFGVSEGLLTSSNGGSTIFNTIGPISVSGTEWTNVSWVAIERTEFANGTLFDFDDVDFRLGASSVPVPATVTLLGLGLAGIGWRSRKA